MRCECCGNRTFGSFCIACKKEVPPAAVACHEEMLLTVSGWALGVGLLCRRVRLMQRDDGVITRVRIGEVVGPSVLVRRFRQCGPGIAVSLMPTDEHQPVIVDRAVMRRTMPSNHPPGC